MYGAILDDEIRCGLILACNAGAHAGVAGLQAAVFQAGIITADCFVEACFAALVESIVEALAPTEVRPEFAPSAEIDGDMHAEPVMARDWVYQMIERRFAGQGVVVTYRVIVRRDSLSRHTSDR